MSDPSMTTAHAAAPLRLGSPSFVDGLLGDLPAVTISRAQALSVLGEVSGHVSWQVLLKLGRLFASPIAYLSDEERQRERSRVLEQMLENKRRLIQLLQERLRQATTEDDRERFGEELYAWLMEDIRERTAVSQPGGAPGEGVKVSVCDPGCVDILARVIYAEAAAESDGIMAAMGWVVINRVRDQAHEFRNLDTCEEVIMQPNAFSSVGGALWVAAGNPGGLAGPARAAYDRARSIAGRICSGELADPTQGALLYYSPQAMVPPGSRPARWNFGILEEVVIPGVTNGALKLFRYR